MKITIQYETGKTISVESFRHAINDIMDEWNAYNFREYSLLKSRNEADIDRLESLCRHILEEING